MRRPSRIWTCIPAIAAMLAAGAADALSFNATLSSIKASAKPGQVINRTYTLTLPADQKATRFKAHVEDWWPSEDGKQSFYEKPGTLDRSAAPWVTLNPVEATVQPGETLEVRVSIAVPMDLEPAGAGGYWAALTVDEVLDPTAAPQGIGIQFLASVSTGIFVYIDPVEREASILDVQIGQDEARVTLRNDGNAPIGVEGRLEIMHPGEAEPFVTALIPRRTLVPQPVRTGILSAALPDASVLPSGHYQVRVVLDIGLEHYIGVQRQMEIRRDIETAQAK
jgi:hypothetical protein